MDEILNEIKRIQRVFAQKANKFGDRGLDDFDVDDLLNTLGDSVSLNRVLYMRVKELEGLEESE